MAFPISLGLTFIGLIVYMFFGPQAGSLSPDRDVQFAAYLLNGLSISWLVIVLARTETKDADTFGEEITKNLPSLYTAIGISGSYSIVQLFYMLVPITAPSGG